MKYVARPPEHLIAPHKKKNNRTNELNRLKSRKSRIKKTQAKPGTSKRNGFFGISIAAAMRGGNPQQEKAKNCREGPAKNGKGVLLSKDTHHRANLLLGNAEGDPLWGGGKLKEGPKLGRNKEKKG